MATPRTTGNSLSDHVLPKRHSSVSGPGSQTATESPDCADSQNDIVNIMYAMCRVLHMEYEKQTLTRCIPSCCRWLQPCLIRLASNPPDMSINIKMHG